MSSVPLLKGLKQTLYVKIKTELRGGGMH